MLWSSMGNPKHNQSLLKCVYSISAYSLVDNGYEYVRWENKFKVNIEYVKAKSMSMEFDCHNEVWHVII